MSLPSYSTPLKTAVVAALLTAFAVLIPAATSFAAEPEYPAVARAGFKIVARGISTNLKLASVFVLPGESLYVATPTTDGSKIAVSATDGALSELPTKWRWIAPSQPGIFDVTVVQLSPADTIRLRAFVMHPMSRVVKGRLNGYRIGDYPKKPYKNLPQYKPPRGFIEVTEANADTKVSPHFRLGQFVCKQEGAYPKYIVLRELLLLKLELLLEIVNQAGYSYSTFHVMSGYRTPWYNKAIGNVKYSRHQWGGAADIFVDEHPADGVMDDLNRDGHSDWRDAEIIYDIIDGMYGTEPYERFVGGLARYRKTADHGPFIHVDVRGFRARWGD